MADPTDTAAPPTEPVLEEENQPEQPIVLDPPSAQGTDEVAETEAKPMDTENLIGQKVKKKFGRKNFYGTIKSQDKDTKWYKVEYDDDDEEELEVTELRTLLYTEPELKAPKEVKEKKPAAKPTKTTPRRERKAPLKLENVEPKATTPKAPKAPKPPKEKVEKKKRVPKIAEKKGKEGGAEAKPEAEVVEKGEEAAVEEPAAQPAEIDNGAGAEMVDQVVRKKFGKAWFTGTIKGYDPEYKFYKVKYSDNDEEELTWLELEPLLKAAEKAEVMAKKRAAKEEAEALKPKKVRKVVPGEPRQTRARNVEPPAVRGGAGASLSSWSAAESRTLLCWRGTAGAESARLQSLPSLEVPVCDLRVSSTLLAARSADGHIYVLQLCQDQAAWEHVALEVGGACSMDIVDCPDALPPQAKEDQQRLVGYLAVVGKEKDALKKACLGSEGQLVWEDCPSLSAAATAALCPPPVGNILSVSASAMASGTGSLFVGYLLDSRAVYVRRAASGEGSEAVCQVVGFQGSPLKLELLGTGHGILLTEDGKVWQWQWSVGGMPQTVSCTQVEGTILYQKVHDICGCGWDLMALTSDANVHMWTVGPMDEDVGLLPVPTIQLRDFSQKLAVDDCLAQVALGVGMAAGVSRKPELHTWKTRESGRHWRGPLGQQPDGADTLVRLPSSDARVVFAATALNVLVVAVVGKLESPEDH